MYDQQRQAIMAPLDTLEDQFKTYKKIYDPKKGTDWLERKKKKAEENKKVALEIYEVIKKCFSTIIALAGEDKREFMEKEIIEIDEKKQIVDKVDKALTELTEFNQRLHKMVDQLAALRAWMIPASEKLTFITTSVDLSPEDRVKEIFDLQGQVGQERQSLYIYPMFFFFSLSYCLRSLRTSKSKPLTILANPNSLETKKKIEVNERKIQLTLTSTFQVNERLPLLEPLETEVHALLDGKSFGTLA